MPGLTAIQADVLSLETVVEDSSVKSPESVGAQSVNLVNSHTHLNQTISKPQGRRGREKSLKPSGCVSSGHSPASQKAAGHPPSHKASGYISNYKSSALSRG
jgi:hypothetical protein